MKPHVGVATPEVQARATPQDILSLLEQGNERFATGQTLSRDPRRQVNATASGQSPLAVVLACMDSRVATEMIFDLGLGDIFSIRMAGNIVSDEALGGMEFGCALVGAKLVLVLGHTRCGAVSATVDHVLKGADPEAAALENLASITEPIAVSVKAERDAGAPEDAGFADRVAVANVHHSMREIRERSRTLRSLMDEGRVLLVGGLYDVATGRVRFLESEA